MKVSNEKRGASPPTGGSATGSRCGNTSSRGRWHGQRSGSLLGDERHRGAFPIDFGERFVKDRGVVLRQPVAEQAVWHPDGQRGAIVRHERRRFEPGVEDVPVDFRLDASEDLIPDAAGHVHAYWPKSWGFGDFRPMRARSCPLLPNIRRQKAQKHGLFRPSPPQRGASRLDRARQSGRKTSLFHIFFHSCGKLRGETLRPVQARDFSTRSGDPYLFAQGRDFSTRSRRPTTLRCGTVRRIDSIGDGRYYLSFSAIIRSS